MRSSYRTSESGTDGPTGVLRVVIPYTTPELTSVALRHAAVCTDLNVQVSLIDIQVVPFPCSLDQPPINRKFSKQRLHALLEHSGLPGEVEVLYVRDWLDGFRRALAPHSLVIMSSKSRWWRTKEERLGGNVTEGKTSSDVAACMR
jgi:hypothetical protein